MLLHGDPGDDSGCSLTGGPAAQCETSSVTFLGPSLGRSGDIADGHAVNSTDVVASAGRALAPGAGGTSG